jgi:Zn-dependent peptidase ImmA (M78 family)/transcriptional regulator with XRE-family HTH domain
MTGSKIKPEMVTLARRAKGFSQKDLADSINMSPAYVWKMETESRILPDEILNRLSSVLDCPSGFFFEDWTIYPVRAPHYRKRAALSAQTREMVEAIANIQRMHVHKLLRGIELKTNYLPMELDDFDGSPQKIAQATRQHWRLPSGPVKNIMSIIEGAGIIVIKSDFGTRLLDGFTISDNFNPPVIYINKDLPGDRQRFTLAHEVAHLIMHSYMTENMEKEADIFAAEFLMPEVEIKPDLISLTLQKLATLKKKWLVSMGALLYRAKDLFGADFTNQYDYLVKQMSRLGYRLREPSELDVPFEEPALLKKFFSMYEERGITKKMLAESFPATYSFFSKLYECPTNPFIKEKMA